MLKQTYNAWLDTRPDPATDAAFLVYMAEPITVTTSPTWVTIRTLHEVLGSANAELLVATLEGTVAAINADANATQEQQAMALIISRALGWMNTPGDVSGIDVGSANTRTNLQTIGAMIPSVTAETIFTIIGLADSQVPRSQTLGLGTVGQPQLDRLRLDGEIE